MSKRTTKNERQPLLPPTNDPERHEIIKATPLPKLQLSILLMLQLAEPMTSQIIYSFVNQVCCFGNLDVLQSDDHLDSLLVNLTSRVETLKRLDIMLVRCLSL